MNKIGYNLKLLELFGGIGASREALQRILPNSVETVGYVENNKTVVNIYNKIFNCNEEPIDINKYEPRIGLNVDILVHGSPCQDFSIAGKRDINKGRSILYKRSLYLIKKINPKVVIWENVLGLKSKKNKVHLESYLNEMDKNSYVNFTQVYDSKYFGTAQSRKRIYIISIRNDLLSSDKYQLLKTSFLNLEKQNKINVVLEDILQNENIDKSYYLNATYNNSVFKSNYIKTSTLNINKKIAIPFEEFKNFYVIPRNSDSKLVNGSYNRVWKISSNAPTITASNPNKILVKANPNLEMPIFVINNIEYNIRRLTEFEAWILMGWDKSEFNKVSNSSGLWKSLGNSIVINVLESIFKTLLSTLKFDIDISIETINNFSKNIINNDTNLKI